MPISAKVIADSIGPAGVRLTTFVLVYPRFIHAEIMTHRAFSRNAASSRAIPAKKLRERIMADPALPVFWGKNQAGMQAAEEVEDKDAFKNWWLRGLEAIERLHIEGESKGYHKQIVNRIIEPWMHIEVVLTADQMGLAQMFHQRRHKDAQPEFQALAQAMWTAYCASQPKIIVAGEWHLPFIDNDDRNGADALVWEQYGDRVATGRMSPQEVLKKYFDLLKAVSVGRCARVSYLNHEGRRAPEDDVALHDRLKSQSPGHWSPFEHVACALETPERIGNLHGWRQYRKEFANENLTTLPEI